MINKKLMIFAIFLVSLLAVSAVSAADNATSDIVSAEETTDDVVSVENNDAFLKENNNVGTFDELTKEITAIAEGGVLNLTKDYKYTTGSSDGIEINKAITINGKGHTLDGNHLSRIFYVNAEEVTLKDIIFIDGYAEGHGGAVYWNGDNGVLSGCSFVNSSASGRGAVYWYGDNGNLNNCSFINSLANFDGAVSWYGDNGNLNNCSFINSSSENRAGAVYWSGADGVLSGCSFVDCSSLNNYGGAVYWSGADGVLSGCSFVDCSADYGGGGAVYWYGDNGVLSGCSFEDCSSKYGGGAVYWYGADGVLANCIFLGCSAEYSGGAVYWYGDNGVLSRCSFVDCSALNDNGGAVYWDGNNGVVIRSSFKYCSAVMYGGGIYFDAKNCSLIIPCYFEGNIAKYDRDWHSVYDLIIINDTKTPTVITAPDVSTTYGVSKNLIATLKDIDNIFLAGEAISIVLNNVKYTLETNSKGQASFALPKNLAPKTYTATISYAGNEIYESSSTTANIVVSKAGTVISAPDVSLAYKDSNAELTATIINEHGKPLVVTLSFNINGKTYTAKTDSNGQASIPIGTLSPGTYTATITYKGSSNYKASTTTAQVTVNKADTIITASDVNVAYKDPNGELTATIINEHGKPLVVTLSVNLNGKTYTAKTDSNGQTSIPIGTLAPGTYTATITYKGSSNYKASTTTSKVTVTKSDTIISAPNINVAYKDPNAELVATIINEHGKPLVVTLSVDLNGKTYTAKTDSNGQASIAIGTLTPGKYTATISYKGSSNYKASSATAKVTVTKADTIISAPNVKIAYKDPSGELVATIVNEHGKPLVVNLNVNINGKDYTVKTDSNGQASIAVDTLTPGTYTATISYKGSSNYKASSTTAKITVTKAATIITAPDVTVAKNDPDGKLVSTIVNEHGKPLVVSLNVELNGKTYSVKTDSNGQTSVSTADLAPGTYTATISYKGSGNYKASSTTANIKVKK